MSFEPIDDFPLPIPSFLANCQCDDAAQAERRERDKKMGQSPSIAENRRRPSEDVDDEDDADDEGDGPLQMNSFLHTNILPGKRIESPFSPGPGGMTPEESDQEHRRRLGLGDADGTEEERTYPHQYQLSSNRARRASERAFHSNAQEDHIRAIVTNSKAAALAEKEGDMELRASHLSSFYHHYRRLAELQGITRNQQRRQEAFSYGTVEVDPEFIHHNDMVSNQFASYGGGQTFNVGGMGDDGPLLMPSLFNHPYAK